MERSVDSIGTCSLDVEASAVVSDWSDLSSAGTLRSASITPIAPDSHHLPSYLSLACTVNGYSTTTNYDSVRLARSRDASPHRIDHLTKKTDQPNSTHSVRNNLLSPPNLVPLPPRTIETMTENTLAQRHHQDFFRKSESRFSSSLFSNDTIDACIENGHSTYQSKCVSFESKTVTTINGQSKTTSESTVRKEFSNGKSFIQQRVERLYGPGALAQGFFVSKRNKNRLSESESDKDKENDHPEKNKHNKSMQDALLLDSQGEISPMKQSTSSPTLPVMRHLRPEFRAQLPMFSPRKEQQAATSLAQLPAMPKSVTVPKLKDDDAAPGKFTNGNSADAVTNGEVSLAAILKPEVRVEVEEIARGVKDGHYFLIILEEQNKRLLGLAEKTEKELENPKLTEEVVGKIRSAAGKAKLLVSQKMQQFKGLCTNNINQVAGEAYPTTNEDLQGFWDMVMLQVNQVDALFEEISALKKNDWKEVKPTKSPMNGSSSGKSARKGPIRVRQAPSVNEEARKQREAERKKMIEERRKAMKSQNQNHTQNIEIFVPESS
ncbi:unnamed protein product [Brassicogethes aeneus]|uniref:Uncharacterized protein n=1 Tax=Brassicogethes aeneus TaxID=1431903 RepID=A0A9P0FDM0_BRAAE|nr:unnamed protein product [Brassicogethes aeneus]